MTKVYLAVTIGPIIDTLDLATYPAALWYASSMFSYLTGRLCERFRNELGACIISPYYAPTPAERHQDENGFFTEGAGLFHDRIFCAVETEDIDALKDRVNTCVTDVRAEMKENIYLNKQAEGYLNIHYLLIPAQQVQQEQKNCVLALSDYLDGLELCPAFRTEAQDEPLLSIFKKKENDELKNSPMLKAVKPAVLTEPNRKSLRAIDSICGYQKHPDWQRQNYFAVVQADGDSMREVLEKKRTDEDVTEFSRSCLDYAMEAAQLVHSFGAMPIYAGGDDLLFLSPVVNREGNSVFQLCQALSTLYDEKLNKGVEGVKTSLSFGVSIQFYKFPLYEALNRARDLLLHKAKKFCQAGDKPTKNCMAIQLEKHSGRCFALCVEMGHVKAFNEMLFYAPKKEKADGENEAADELLQSVPYHLEQGAQFFQLLDERPDLPEDRYLTFLRNYLKRSEDDPQDGYLQEIAKYYRDEIFPRHCQSETVKEDDYEPLRALINVLRLNQFLNERGGGED
ncbi:MAG: hypothetical protein LIO95_01935 [Clostridiales bacterium]|nr:hypothetical protein [Clostridiales bacterium]